MTTTQELLNDLKSIENRLQRLLDRLQSPIIEPEMVQVSETLMMSKYPVTQQLYKAVMGNNPSYFEGDTHPVERVSWYDVQAFIERLNSITGKAYALPTEYQWILAATVDNTIYSGSDDIAEVAWCNSTSDGKTHPVGLKKPNSLGLYDMSGNVWEWCEDGNSTDRVIRGGSWNINAEYCRVAYRYRFNPDYRSGDVGFRLVLPFNL